MQALAFGASGILGGLVGGLLGGYAGGMLTATWMDTFSKGMSSPNIGASGVGLLLGLAVVLGGTAVGAVSGGVGGSSMAMFAVSWFWPK
jgi:hypothetical protein